MSSETCQFCNEQLMYSGSNGRQVCTKCRSISKYRQCYYCKCDYKPKQSETLCHKCLSQEKSFGKPRRCEICQLKNAFSGALCIRCNHYKSKCGNAVKCQSCLIEAAFVKDKESRDKVNGQILCWQCTYKYKKENLSTYKSKSRNNDPDFSKTREVTKRKLEPKTTDSLTSTSIKLEPYPLLKRSRTAEGSLESSSLTGIPAEPTDNIAAIFNGFVASNDQLEVNSKLQEENKALRRQLQQKDDTIYMKERALTEIKAEMLDMRTMHVERVRQMESGFESEMDKLKDRIRQLQKDISIMDRQKRRQSRKYAAKTEVAKSDSSSDNSSKLS